MSSRGGRSALIVRILVRWIITSDTSSSSSSSSAAEHVALGARDAALAMQKIDGAAQFLVARERWTVVR